MWMCKNLSFFWRWRWRCKFLSIYRGAYFVYFILSTKMKMKVKMQKTILKPITSKNWFINMETCQIWQNTLTLVKFLLSLQHIYSLLTPQFWSGMLRQTNWDIIIQCAFAARFGPAKPEICKYFKLVSDTIKYFIIFRGPSLHFIGSILRFYWQGHYPLSFCWLTYSEAKLTAVKDQNIWLQIPTEKQQKILNFRYKLLTFTPLETAPPAFPHPHTHWPEYGSC